MMQWFRRNSPGFLSVKEEEGAGPSMASWMEAFKSHWVQAHSVMEQKEGGNPVQPDQVITIFNHMDQMVHLLLLEMNNDNTSIGPIMDETFSLEVFGCTVDWALNADGAIVPCQASLLKLFESLISQAQLVGGRQSILVHKPILQPLLRLLDSCARSPAPDIEKRLVILLNQICVSIAKDDSLLEFFFNESPEDDMPKFSVFSLLIPFLYKEGDIGQFARDSILLILSASRKSDSVGLFIAEHSNFCPVLATGLSGLYSTLPRKLRHSSDDWHCITRRDIDAVPELKAFHSTLEFCNAVVQVGHQYVQEQLLNFIYQGFLLPVIGPALNQPSLEEIVASTAYLEMFFTSVTEPPLLRVLVRFLLCASNDSVPLLEALVTRISSNSRLCLVSLSLFNTLLSLNCEDLIYELILKYLVPCTHVMVSQTKSIRPVDIYTRSSEKFLSLIPNSCLHGGGEEEETDKSDQRSAVNDSGYEDAGFPDAFDSLFASYSIGPSQGTRQNGPKVPKQASPPNKSPRESLLLSFDSYLADAREQVQSCYVACLRWSLPYDGHNPDPMMFREDDSLDHASSCATLTSVGTLAADEAEGRMYANSTMRQSALSVSNSYFTAPRLSSLYGYSQFGAPYGISSLELTLGQEDFFIALEGLEPLELNSHGGPKGSEEGGSSSTLSTPVHSRRPGDRPPPDYLKLTYDEDSHGFSAGEEYESDFPGSASAGAMTSNPFVLMGWSQVEDEDAFVELLNRVRCGSKLTGVCTQAHMDLIDEFYDRVTAESPKTEDTDALDKEQTPKPEQDQDDGVSDDPAQKEAETMKEEPGVYTPLLMMPTPAEDAYRGSFKNPNVGPFLGVVLHKAEHMVTNSLFVNLQLTGLLARLAVYPQPLLASFLLNDQLVFQPSVKSLVQILSNVKHRVDSWALTVENWDELLTRGRDFLAGREERYRHDVAEMQRASMPKGRVTGPNKTRSFSLLSNGPSQSSGANRRLKMKRAGSLEHSDTGYRYIHRADSPKSALDLIKTKNVVYCAIVLEEFLQEMAATCQEHALSTRLDLLPGQFI